MSCRPNTVIASHGLLQVGGALDAATFKGNKFLSISLRVSHKLFGWGKIVSHRSPAARIASSTITPQVLVHIVVLCEKYCAIPRALHALSDPKHAEQRVVSLGFDASAISPILPRLYSLRFDKG